MTLFDHPVWLDAIERAEDDRRKAFASAEGAWRRFEADRFVVVDCRRKIVEEANAVRQQVINEARALRQRGAA